MGCRNGRSSENSVLNRIASLRQGARIGNGVDVFPYEVARPIQFEKAAIGALADEVMAVGQQAVAGDIGRVK